MRTPTSICPLIAIASIGTTSGPVVCLEDRCAWWDHAGNKCIMVTGAIAVLEVAENLEELAANSQALANLQQKAPASVGRTDRGGVEQPVTGTGSAFSLDENGGFVK